MSGLQGAHAIGLHFGVSSVALEDVLIIQLKDIQGQYNCDITGILPDASSTNCDQMTHKMTSTNRRQPQVYQQHEMILFDLISFLFKITHIKRR